jgi:hypothetical protein
VDYTTAKKQTITVTLNRGTNHNAGIFAVAVNVTGPDSLAVCGTAEIIDGENLTNLGKLDWAMPNVDEKRGGTAITFSGDNQLYQDETYPFFVYSNGTTYPGTQNVRAYYRYDSPTTSIVVPAGRGTVTLFIGADVTGSGASYRVTMGKVTTGDVPYSYRKKITVDYTTAKKQTITVTLNRGTNHNAGIFAVAVRQLPMMQPAETQ